MFKGTLCVCVWDGLRTGWRLSLYTGQNKHHLNASLELRVFWYMSAKLSEWWNWCFVFNNINHGPIKCTCFRFSKKMTTSFKCPLNIWLWLLNHCTFCRRMLPDRLDCLESVPAKLRERRWSGFWLSPGPISSRGGPGSRKPVAVSRTGAGGSALYRSVWQIHNCCIIEYKLHSY